MNRIILPAALLALALSFGGWPQAARAATMNYCETYADRVAQYSPDAKAGAKARQFVRDKAFYECLNMDEEPPLPQDALGLSMDPSGSPFKVLDAPDPSMLPDQPQLQAQPEKPAGPASQEAGVSLDADTPGVSAKASVPIDDDGQGRGSGQPRGSEKWKAFCAKYYPNSFDEKTGTVVPAKLGKRVACR